jgi:thiol:disulfide interchange protein
VKPSQQWLLIGTGFFLVGLALWIANVIVTVGDFIMLVSMAPLAEAFWLQMKERKAELTETG